MSNISQKQLEANQVNAQSSTGPKTAEGKATSRYNAVKHGLLSDKVLFEKENGEELEELGKRLRTDLKPRSEIELLLTDRIVANFWRLSRAMKLEKGEVISNYSDGGLMHDADIFFRYETMLERGIYKALHELQRIQAGCAGEKPPLPAAIDIDVSGVKE